MKVGTMLMSSNFFANTALMKPPSENTAAVSTTVDSTMKGCLISRCVKNSATTVTTPPTSRPRTMPPATWPSTMR
jgi:hypothetical protein